MGRKPLLIPRELAHFLHVFQRVSVPPLPSVLNVGDIYNVFTAVTFDSNTETHKLKYYDPVKLHVRKGNKGASLRSRCWDCVLLAFCQIPLLRLPLALHRCHRCRIQTSRLYPWYHNRQCSIQGV